MMVSRKAKTDAGQESGLLKSPSKRDNRLTLYLTEDNAAALDHFKQLYPERSYSDFGNAAITWWSHCAKGNRLDGNLLPIEIPKNILLMIENQKK